MTDPTPEQGKAAVRWLAKWVAVWAFGCTAPVMFIVGYAGGDTQLALSGFTGGILAYLISRIPCKHPGDVD